VTMPADPAAARPRPRVGILHYTAPPVVGGVETVIAEHTRLLVQAGFPTTLLVGRGQASSLPAPVALRRIPSLDSEDATTLELAAELERGHVPPGFEVRTQSILASLQDAVRDVDVLIVHNILTMHFNLPLTAALHRMLDSGAGPRVISWDHDASWIDPQQRPKLHRGLPWSLLRSARRDVQHIVLSRERQVQMAAMFRCPQERLRVIPNGIPIGFWWALSPEGEDLISRLGLLEQDLVILQPTRITQLKNLTTSLRIARALKDVGGIFRLVVTGPPDPHDPQALALLRELLDLRRELQLEEEVVFVCLVESGPDRPRTLPMETVRDLYMASDVVLLPSTSEGFGIPLLEAGISGRAVFCADIPPFREIGRSLTHRFRLDEDPGAVVARILTWARRDRGYLLRRRVRQQFTWRGVFRSHLLPLLETA
jgi:glycosyltransferase involved in cell wall biosynthesis